MSFSNEDIYAQFVASGMSLKNFHAKYYSHIPYDAWRHRMKRVKQKQREAERFGEVYDKPLIDKALAGIKDRWVKIAVLSDIHFGDHDRQALELAYKTIELFQPHIVTFGGDEVNFPAFSRHPSDPRNDKSEEPDAIKAIVPFHQMHVMAVESAVPNAIKIFIMGNHEFWALRETMAMLPGAIGVMEDAFVNMVRCNGKVLYPGETDRINLFGINIQHISKGGVHPAKNNLTEYAFQESVVAQHIHRFNMYHYTGPKKQVVSVTNRCLCNLVPYYRGYIGKPTGWEHGITLLEIPQFALEQMPVVHPLLFTKEKGTIYTRFWGQELRTK